MSTALIIVLVVVVVVIVAGALFFVNRGKSGAGSLRRRFGPEYDRAVTHHNGDVKAAEQELAERLKKHGSLHERPLAPEQRERYLAQWAGLQERFVDSPREAVAGADQLVAELAEARGFSGAGHAQRVEALSVHHPHHVDGYRRLHDVTSADAGGEAGQRTGTEELREAMVRARGLFDELAGADAHGQGVSGTGHDSSHTAGNEGPGTGSAGHGSTHQEPAHRDPAQDQLTRSDQDQHGNGLPQRRPAPGPTSDGAGTPPAADPDGAPAPAPGTTPNAGTTPASTRDVKGS